MTVRSTSFGSFVAALGALLAALTFTGCGATGNALTTVDRAATKTMSTTGGWIVELQGAQAFGPVRRPLYGRGTGDFAQGLEYSAIAFPALPGRRRGNVFFVWNGDRIYVDSVAVTSPPQHPVRPWLALSFTPATVAPLAPVAVTLEGLNPELLLEEIRWGAVAVTDQGHQVVDHLPLERYLVRVNLRQARVRAGKDAKWALASAIAGQLVALGTSKQVELTAWTDGPGYIARLEAEIPGSGLGTVSFRIAGFGAPVATNLPSQGLVVDRTPAALAGQSPALALVGLGS
jgi:hypothetical protein